MPTYYLDYENGDDANDGSDWANAWKTITNGPTAARIAPGDVIRIAKSPDPTAIGNATWNNLSKTVTLAGALTANIELCETAWTASANVTATISTTEKEGAYAAQIAFASGFTTGLAAYKALGGATDFSSYEQVSFWIRTNVAIAVNTLTLRLCSDTVGAVTVDTIAIPAIPGINRWQVVTVDTGGALGNSIQSVALYAELDPGTPTILLDDIIACKASSSADSLTLSSLISKNNAAQGGAEGFYGIRSIDGTTVILDTDTNAQAPTGKGYSGTTETVASYKRETIKTAVAPSSSTQVQVLQDSGTSGNLIEYQGGWNVATTTQDGETYFDGQNGNGNGIHLSSKSYNLLNYLSVCRYKYGIYFSSSNNNIITTLTNANNNNYGIYFFSSNSNTIVTLRNVNNNSNYGIYMGDSNGNTVTTLTNANNNNYCGVVFDNSHNNTIATLTNTNNNGYGVYFVNCNNNTITTLTNANDNGYYGIYFDESNDNTIKTLTNTNNNEYGIYFYHSSNNHIMTLNTTGNSSAGIYNGHLGTNYIRNATIVEATEVTGFTLYADMRIYSWRHDNTDDNHWIFTDGGTINSQTATRHTASGIAWKFIITSSNRSSSYPLKLKIAEVAVNANALVTVKAWLKKDHATDVAAKLVCPGGQLTGIASDVIATKTDDTNWEQLTITFTPTQAGVIEIEAWAYYVSGNSNVYVDDFSVTQA